MVVEDKKQNQELIVNTGTVIGSAYSQIARVTISGEEMTIEFGYVHPTDLTQGQTVARITMPIRAGLNLAQTILQLQKFHEKRKEGNQNG